jgi:hypothetical protein
MAYPEYDTEALVELLQGKVNGLTSDEIWLHSIFVERAAQAKVIGFLKNTGVIYLDGTKYRHVDNALTPSKAKTPVKHTASQARLHANAIVAARQKVAPEQKVAPAAPEQKVAPAAPEQKVSTSERRPYKKNKFVRRGTNRGTVLLFLSAYKDTYFSIDIICKYTGLSRQDVAIVLYNEKEFCEKFGELRQATYRWCSSLKYPFESRTAEDEITLGRFAELKAVAEGRAPTLGEKSYPGAVPSEATVEPICLPLIDQIRNIVYKPGVNVHEAYGAIAHIKIELLSYFTKKESLCSSATVDSTSL